LNFSWTCKADGARELVQSLRFNTTLEVLNISRCGFKEEAAELLVQVMMQHNNSLRDLRLIPNSKNLPFFFCCF